ncbi:MAG: hypothetical protein L0Y62_02010 [Nitrospirae bacterium]|nr:hypothetical protein [Nitrospirota bacterium]
MTSWLIDWQCPQCGAPVKIAETERFFSCSFCRVRLYLIHKGYPRLYLEPSDKAMTRDIIFVPYWRFKGLEFLCRAEEIEKRVIDKSLIASAYPYLPISLGYRTQVLKIRFAAPETDGSFIRPKLPAEDADTKIKQFQIADDSYIASPPYHRTFIGEVKSIVYSPFFCKNNVVYDAILNREIPFSRNTPDNICDESVLTLDDRKTWGVKFLSSLCPYCGWDLSGSKESAVLFCQNCNSAWEEWNGEFRKIGFSFIKTAARDVIYLPFWVFKAKIGSIKLETYADLIRLANLPKIIRTEWEEHEISFWSPALKTPPDLFLRLARYLTAYQLHEFEDIYISKPSMHHATLSSNEAAETIKTTIAELAVDKERLYPNLPKISVEIREHSLIFCPFVQKGYELIQPEMKFAVHINAIKWIASVFPVVSATGSSERM